MIPSILFSAAFLTAMSCAAFARVIPQWIGAAYFGASVITLIAYARDKARAEQGEWRIAENTLHILEAAGGWPGALLAQAVFRHKTRKVSFQIIFWLIVLGHLGFWAWQIAKRHGWHLPFAA